MQKIISLFQRNYEGDRLVRDEVTFGADWVIYGEGVATRKWDGLALMYKEGMWYKRYDAKAFTVDGDKKRNYNRKPPEDFIPVQDPDPVTGHWPGWVPCDRNNPANMLIILTIDLASQVFLPGTYELVGPKVGTRGGSNPEKLDEHLLIKHGEHVLDAPRTFDELKTWFADKDIEGIVWHHPDGRMVKIKKKDFGYKR
jgi:hypothetical protein